MYLGRPWGWQQVGGDASTVFINTKMAAAVRNVGWLTWNANETNAANGKNNGNPVEDSRYAEYNSMDLTGTIPIDVSQRVAWSHQLTAAEAAAYTVADLFSFESGYGWYGLGYPAGDLNNPGTGSPNPGIPILAGRRSGAIGIPTMTRPMRPFPRHFRRRETPRATRIRIGRWRAIGIRCRSWRMCRSRHHWGCWALGRWPSCGARGAHEPSVDRCRRVHRHRFMSTT